ncbi:MAG: hypothetical protein MI863_11130 [Desulfobacterales bacterium]|nr:hypothetical protein [Desulfobacterales bacterium]
MGDYIIGGWSQNTSESVPAGFSYTMYGMITNLEGLTSGTPESPGWSPAEKRPPKGGGKVLWTYGGGGCTPGAMPGTPDQIGKIVAVTEEGGWAGVDFDDECHMDMENVITAMQALKEKSLGTSYTFLAGWDYNNPSASAHGQAINEAVQAVAKAGAADRQILMCYAAAMWSMSDIEANVGPAITRTIDNGVPPGQVILALTPAGLTSENLNYFLSQVTEKGIGGLFIWNYPALNADDLETIKGKLGISA